MTWIRMPKPPIGAKMIARVVTTPQSLLYDSEYRLASGERFWTRLRSDHCPAEVEVYVYRPFFARLADAWAVLKGEPRR